MKSVAATTSQANEDLASTAERMLGVPVTVAEPTGAGANSKVFRLETSSASYALKRYPSWNGDERPRAEVEWRALNHFRAHGIVGVPMPVAVDPDANILIMEWIEGAHPGEWTAAILEKAMCFIAAVFASSNDPAAASFPLASEACLSGRAIVSQIECRLGSFISDAALDKFLRDRFLPLFNRVAAFAAGPAFEADLVLHHRRLVPADFGIHNAIMTRDGTLYFIDFDYMGWEDPAKLVGDILLHPAVPFPVDRARYLSSTVRDMVPGDEAFIDRLSRYLPLYGLRWALIVLNIYRRDRQVSDGISVKYQRQLQLAEKICDKAELLTSS